MENHLINRNKFQNSKHKMFAWLQNRYENILRKMIVWLDERIEKNLSYDEFDKDPLGWSRDLTMHHTGEFCMAAVRANEVVEDYCQVETGTQALFIGLYHGHQGDDTCKYLSQKLFQNLLMRLQQNNDMSEDVLRQAISDTEEGFMTVVERGYLLKPELGRAGSCCLVGVIWRGTIYIANLGGSRAVIGSLPAELDRLHVEQLTTDHNCNNEPIRQDLRQLHSDDPQIVLHNRGAWRVKGIIQVSRTIGDAYLKRLPFTLRASFPKFEEVPEPFTRGVLSAEPELHSRVITKKDNFLIFASDGFWEYMTNDQAAEIVWRFPPNGIAKKLLRTALTKAARKRKISYKQLQGIDKGRDSRLAFHDDITVIVVFLDQGTPPRRTYMPEMSYRGLSETVVASEFRNVSITHGHIVAV